MGEKNRDEMILRDTLGKMQEISAPLDIIALYKILQDTCMIQDSRVRTEKEIWSYLIHLV